jgi:hypothetical protein
VARGAAAMIEREDDWQNLADLKEVEAALIEAHQALTRAMAGRGGTGERERFVFKVGFAGGRLSRVCSRIYGAGATA